MYITQEGVKSEQAVVRPLSPALNPSSLDESTDSADRRLQREEASKITIQATGAISWRRSDVKYRKNEAFVDVIETVNLSMNSKGACPSREHVRAESSRRGSPTLVH